MTSLGRPQGVNFETSSTNAFLLHHFQFYFTKCVPKILSATDATDAAIHKKMFGSGLLIKGISEAIKNEAKEQKGGFLGMLFGTLGVILLGIY